MWPSNRNGRPISLVGQPLNNSPDTQLRSLEADLLASLHEVRRMVADLDIMSAEIEDGNRWDLFLFEIKLNYIKLK
jgi:hypothetical protein